MPYVNWMIQINQTATVHKSVLLFYFYDESIRPTVKRFPHKLYYSLC